MPPIKPGYGVQLWLKETGWEYEGIGYINFIESLFKGQTPTIFPTYEAMHKWVETHGVCPNPLAYCHIVEVPLPSKPNLSPVLFGSGDKVGSYEWCTPKHIFQKYDSTVHYDVDLAATYFNKLCEDYIGPCPMTYPEYARLTALEKLPKDDPDKIPNGSAQAFLKTFPHTDLLSVPWHPRWKRGWLNPPYGNMVGDVVYKAYEETSAGMELVTLLLPSRTDTQWFHAWVLPLIKDEHMGVTGRVEFIPGRIKFEYNGEAMDPAPFPSIVVHFAHRRVPKW